MDFEEKGFYGCGGSSGDAMSLEGRGNEVDYTAAVSHNHKPYKILTEDDIRRLFDNDISTVADFLAISRGAACDLLFRNNWILSSVFDQWLAADRNPQPAAANSAQQKLGQQVCNNCYDEITSENLVSAACGHLFCSDCCKTYVAKAISDGPGCLTLSCPDPGCGAALGVELVESLASEEGKDKYYKHLRRSYVELSHRRKWCPALGCGLAVEFHGGGRGGYDITCGCGHKFCWNCMEEHHRPVDCETVASWMEKNNNYNNSSVSSVRRGREEKREKVMKYIHYYERWHSNEQSRKVAVANLRRWREEYILKLGQVQEEVESHLQFVMDAWEQIVECRRVLKWSYAYGYYLDGECLEKTRFFEYLQREAETGLERLHHCAEKEMEGYLHCYKKDFMEIKVKLAGLTAFTKNYFENFVKVLENHLA